MDFMKDYPFITIALCIVLFFGGYKIYSINENKENYERAIALEDNYDIYYDGKMVSGNDKEDFSIAALGDSSNVSIEINDAKKEIYVNKIQKRDASFHPMPIFIH